MDLEDLDADGIAVMAALATYADEKGVCIPSQTTLAKKLKRSRPWINRVIRDLSDIGLLCKRNRHRPNGGMTSCEYRLTLLNPIAASTTQIHNTTQSAVTSGTNLCPDGDIPCQPDDTNRTNLIKKTRAPSEPPSCHHSDGDIHASDQAEQGKQEQTRGGATEEVPADWKPTQEAIVRAGFVAPGVDAEAHAEMFVRRCRAKGYRYRPDAISDGWLAWLIEDRLRGGGVGKTPSTTQQSSKPKSRESQGDKMFRAFGRAAQNASAWKAAHGFKPASESINT